jgi:hypothetical protein
MCQHVAQRDIGLICQLQSRSPAVLGTVRGQRRQNNDCHVLWSHLAMSLDTVSSDVLFAPFMLPVHCVLGLKGLARLVHKLKCTPVAQLAAASQVEPRKGQGLT